MADVDIRVTDWHKIDEGMSIREYRPAITPPTKCPYGTYDVVRYPMKVEYEGACRNYDITRRNCVYCGASMMSNAIFKIPFDVRARADEIMGW
jgi:hypothetical protein